MKQSNIVRSFFHSCEDTSNLLAFKWRSMRPDSQKLWLIAVLFFAFAVLIVSAATGTALRLIVTPTNPATAEMGRTVLVWLQIFLQDNASMTMGGVLWAYLVSIIGAPLIGYSFNSLMPEGDLESVRVTERHKITDSLFLQFASPVAFLQLVTLTALTSVFAIGQDTPGLAITFSWAVWMLGVIATSMFAYVFEYLLRRWGAKVKWGAIAVLTVSLSILFVSNNEAFTEFYGLGAAYVAVLQSSYLSFDYWWVLLLTAIAFAAAAFVLSLLTWKIGLSALSLHPRVKKTTTLSVLLAKLGLSERIPVSGLGGFLGRLMLRHNNIVKPLLISVVLTAGLALVFHALYGNLVTVSVLIPAMVSLAWGVNIFGILGSGASWLFSLPEGKQRIIKSAGLVQMLAIVLAGVFILLVSLIQKPSLDTLLTYLLCLVAVGAVLTRWSLKRSVQEPHRYRVHMRGESIIPPNKAFSSMAWLFLIGFITAGIVAYTPAVMVVAVGATVWQAYLVQALIAGMLVLWSWASVHRLQERWVTDKELVQHVMKKVGVAD